eukprot:9693125-Ditylum_brightwellii.AAC.1
MILKGDTLTVLEQAEITHRNQTVPHFELCLDDMAKHVFPEKEGQTQKHYMQRNICYSRGTTPLNADEILDIMEFGVLACWCREFTVQGFDPVDQGLLKFVEFCTRLESCEPSKGEPKGKTPLKTKNQGET